MRILGRISQPDFCESFVRILGVRILGRIRQPDFCESFVRILGVRILGRWMEKLTLECEVMALLLQNIALPVKPVKPGDAVYKTATNSCKTGKTGKFIKENLMSQTFLS